MMYAWLVIIVLLTIIELLTVNLVTIWFIASGIIALVLSFLIDSVIIQMTIFVLLGIILLITTRPILNKWLKPKNIKTNFDRVIGMVGIITEDIGKNNFGEVKVDGKKWTAMSNETIKKGEAAKIIDIQGVKLKVEKCEE